MFSNGLFTAAGFPRVTAIGGSRGKFPDDRMKLPTALRRQRDNWFGHFFLLAAAQILGLKTASALQHLIARERPDLAGLESEKGTFVSMITGRISVSRVLANPSHAHRPSLDWLISKAIGVSDTPFRTLDRLLDPVPLTWVEFDAVQRSCLRKPGFLAFEPDDLTQVSVSYLGPNLQPGEPRYRLEIPFTTREAIYALELELLHLRRAETEGNLASYVRHLRDAISLIEHPADAQVRVLQHHGPCYLRAAFGTIAVAEEMCAPQAQEVCRLSTNEEAPRPESPCLDWIPRDGSPVFPLKKLDRTTKAATARRRQR